MPALVPRLAVSAVASLAILAVGTLAVDRTARRDEPARPPSPSGGAALAIAGFAYAPAALTEPGGSSVTVVNQDGSAHTVTSGTREAPDGLFDLDVEAGASATLVAPTAGIHPYFCVIHPGMKGSLEVTP